MWINSIGTYRYRTSKILVCKKEIKCNNVINNTKMVNFDYITKENIKEHERNSTNSWYLHRILIIRGSGSGKTIALFNLIGCQPDIDKIYLYAQVPYEAK